MFIDTHAHLDFRQYDSDRPKVIDRAFSAGLVAIVNVGIDLETSLASVNLSDEYDGLSAAIGFHPHHAKQFNAVAFTKLKALAKHKKVVAIGEIGLDYYRNLSPKPVQQDVFRRQIRLAKHLNLPLVVHIRQAYDDARMILKEERASEVGGVLHCFSGDESMATWAIEEGFHLAFTGVVTFPRSRALHIAATIPIENLLVETDCPFLAPVPYRGKRNEPSYVTHIAEKIAQARGMAVNDLAATTTQNAKRLFRLTL